MESLPISAMTRSAPHFILPSNSTPSVMTFSFGGSAPTSDLIVSADKVIDYAKSFTVYPFYAAGAAESGNTMEMTLWINPFDAPADPSGLYWSQIGQYTNSSGTLSEQNYTYVIAQGTAGAFKAGTPIPFKIGEHSGYRIRAQLTEKGVAANFGMARLVIVTISDL